MIAGYLAQKTAGYSLPKTAGFIIPFTHGQSDQESDHNNDQVIIKQIIEFCREPKSASQIMQKFNLERSYFRRHYLDKMLESGKLKRTEPQKPKSKNQKYYS